MQNHTESRAPHSCCAPVVPHRDLKTKYLIYPAESTTVFAQELDMAQWHSSCRVWRTQHPGLLPFIMFWESVKYVACISSVTMA